MEFKEKKPAGYKNINSSSIIFIEKDLKTNQDIKVEQRRSNSNAIYEFIKSLL